MPVLPAAIATQLSAVCEVLQARLADRLCAIHLYGSAVRGGLQPGSDIDLMVAVAQPLTEEVRHGLMRALLLHSAWPGTSDVLRALEVTVVAIGEVVPWRHPARREMQFGEWLREDIQNGRFEPSMVDHDLAILMTQLRGHSMPLWGPPAQELFDEVPVADLLSALQDTCRQWKTEQDWRGDEKNTVLALARAWFTASTGEITSKGAAATWAMARLPQEHRAVVAHALAAHLHGGAGVLASIPREVASTVRFCQREVEHALAKRTP